MRGLSPCRSSQVVVDAWMPPARSADMRDNLVVSVAGPCRARTVILRCGRRSAGRSSRVIDPPRPARALAVKTAILASRDGEYAGDAAGKAGKRTRVAGAAHRVEFGDRPRPHPRISRCQRERLFGLVVGRSGVAAVGVLGQRGIGEAGDVARPPSQFRAPGRRVSRPTTRPRAPSCRKPSSSAHPGR